MAAFYEKYLQKKERQQMDSPFAKAADKTIRRMAPKFEETRDYIEGALNKDNASPLAKAKFALTEEGKVIDQMGNIYTEAQVRDIARKDQLQGEIDTIQMKIDQEREAEKKAEKARTGQMWKTAAEIVGMGTALIPGVGVPMAMGISKLAGGGADMAIGLDKSYDSPELIAQGAGQLISGVLSTTNVVSQQKLNSSFNAAMPKIAKLPAQEFALVLAQYEQALNKGYKGAMEFTEYLSRFSD